MSRPDSIGRCSAFAMLPPLPETTGAVKTLIDKLKGPVGCLLVLLVFVGFFFLGGVVGDRNAFYLLLATIAFLYGGYFLATAIDAMLRGRGRSESVPVDRGFVPMNVLVGSTIIAGAVFAVMRILPDIDQFMHPPPEKQIVYKG